MLPAQRPHLRFAPPSPKSARFRPNRPDSKRCFERATALCTFFFDTEAAPHPVAEATGPANKHPARPSGRRCEGTGTEGRGYPRAKNTTFYKYLNLNLFQFV